MKGYRFDRAALLLLGVASVALLASGDAQAQQLDSETSEAGGMEDIVVTAQKRVENAQNVPIALTALSNEQITSSGVTGVSDLRATVPALNVTRGAGGFGLPRIRGVGATGQGNGVENPVAIYVDGVYYAASSGALQSLYDAEQVTVLKGPQGTLFGRNATGGLIQISTWNPDLNAPGAKAEVGYGNYDTVRAAAFVSVPLADIVAFSVSGQWEKRNTGFGRNVFTGNDVQDPESWVVRAKLLIEPSESTRVLLAGDWNGTNDSAPAFANFALNTLGQDVPTEIRRLGGTPEHDILADVDPQLTARQYGLSATISHDFQTVSLKSITAFRHTRLDTFFDPDGTTTPTLRIFNANRDETFTQELNLLSETGGPFQWVIGGFYMSGRAGQFPGRTTGLSQFGDNGFNDEFNEVTLESLSGFAEGSYQLTDRTRVTAGFRYTRDDRTLNATLVSFNGATGQTTRIVEPEEQVSFGNSSWRLAIDHRVSEQFMLYASYNRGFRAGTFVPQANPLIVLEPEQLDAFEIGFKSDLFDRRVRFNLAGFYYDQSTVQVQQVIAGVQNIYSARGGAEIYGVDGDVNILLSERLRLFGGFSWVSAKYKEFTDAIISVPFPLNNPNFSTTQFTYRDSATGQTVANTHCLGTFVPPGPGATQAGRDAWYRARLGGNCLLRGDATGNRLQNTPEFTFSLGSTWDVPTEAGTFTIGGNLYYNSGYVANADERVRQKAFTTVNATITWRAPNEKTFVRLWGNNLTDAFYRTQMNATNSGDNGTAGAPRTYGVTVGVDF